MFKRGDIVINRITQVAVGPNSATQSKFDGPYVILETYPDRLQALMENMNTKRSVKAHYSNIQRLKFNPQHNRVPENLDDSIELYFPDRQSQAPTQTQRAQGQGTQSQQVHPSQRDGADSAHPSQRDGADSPQPSTSTLHQPRNDLRRNNPFDDSDEEEERQNTDRQSPGFDWELDDDYQWPPFTQRRGTTQSTQQTTRSSQRPGTPFNRSPADASPEDEAEQDFGDMVQENTEFPAEDTGTSQGGQTTQTKAAEDPKSQQQEETTTIFIQTTQDSQTPRVVDIKTTGGKPKRGAKKRIEKPKVSIRVENDEDTEEIQDSQRPITQTKDRQRKVQVRYVQDQDVPQVETIQRKPRRGRPRKMDPTEAKVPAKKPDKPKVVHKYETRSKQAHPSSNLAHVYTVGEVLYRKQQPDGTYMEVYNIESPTYIRRGWTRDL
jgi:hypothetical protein